VDLRYVSFTNQPLYLAAMFTKKIIVHNTINEMKNHQKMYLSDIVTLTPEFPINKIAVTKLAATFIKRYINKVVYIICIYIFN
jgi:hypothetical protein